MCPTDDQYGDALHQAWGIIANAGMGATHDETVGWQNESPEWQEAAARWRDEVFFPIIGNMKDYRLPEEQA